MDDLTNRLIARAPTLLVAVAIALFVGGTINALSNYASYARNPEFSGNVLTFLWGFVYSVLYQPVVLLAWAAAVKYLSILAGRARL